MAFHLSERTILPNKLFNNLTEAGLWDSPISKRIASVTFFGIIVDEGAGSNEKNQIFTKVS